MPFSKIGSMVGELAIKMGVMSNYHDRVISKDDTASASMRCPATMASVMPVNLESPSGTDVDGSLKDSNTSTIRAIFPSGNYANLTIRSSMTS
jgi:hypothetical protein